MNVQSRAGGGADLVMVLVSRYESLVTELRVALSYPG